MKSSKSSHNELDLNHLTLPMHISHIKSGSTLCSNGKKLLVFQDGSTTIELSAPPKFEMKKIPWRHGLVRDITWCSALGQFLLLTQKSLFALGIPSSAAGGMNESDLELTALCYSRILPYANDKSFWRCVCDGTTVYISYSGKTESNSSCLSFVSLFIGFGSVIDEYELGSSSCEFINRWTSPSTCAVYEGIWSTRFHPSLQQLGFTVMDGRNNQWRFELRERKTLNRLWQTVLPVGVGDCEVSPLMNGDWLMINSCGSRLIQLSGTELKTAVEYERELKNAITLGDEYFVIRTKNTIDVHSMKKDEQETKTNPKKK